MKEKVINAYRDCDIKILYGTTDDFRNWMEERNLKSSVGIRPSMYGFTGKEVTEDGEISQFIWFNSDHRDRPESLICGTIAHEATHAVDNIELFICNNPGQGKDERIPRELRARMVETIVSESIELIKEKD